MAAGADINRLILEVDASVALAERGIAQLRRSVESGADGIDKAATRAERGISRIDKSLASAGQRQAGLQQLSFQIGDVSSQLASGTRPAQVFAQQIGQVIQAIQLMQGGGGKLLSFLSGPWGAVITGAVIILANMADKLFEAEDASSKAGKAADFHKMSIADLTKAIDAQTEALGKSVDSAQAAERASLNMAAAARRAAADKLSEAEATLKLAKADLAREEGGTFASSSEAAAVISSRNSQIARIEAQIATLKGTLGTADGNVRLAEIPLLQREGKARTDPAAKAELLYQRQIDLLNGSYAAGTITLKEYNRQLDAAEAKRKRDTPSASSAVSNRQSGRQVNSSEAAAIARGAGFQVNSVDRSNARQRELYAAWVAEGMPADRPVAKPGNSAHEGAGGKWALDIQGGKGVTPASLRKAFAEEGVALTKVLFERGRGIFHVEGSRSEAAGVERRADSDAARRQREADRRKGVADRFQEDVARLDQQLVDARGKLLTNTEERAAAEKQAVQAETDIAVQRVQNDRDLDTIQKQTLAARLQSLADQRKANIDAETKRQLAAETLQIEQLEREGQVEALRHLEAFAPTRAERLRLEMEIIELLYQQQKAEIDKVLASEEASEHEKELARIRLRQLDEARGAQVAEAERQNEGPIDNYLRQLRSETANLDDRFEEIRVRGLENLNDGIADAIMGTRSLGNVFKDVARSIIADLVRIAIQQSVIKPLAELMGGGSGGGGGGLLGKILGIGMSAAAGALGKGGGGSAITVDLSRASPGAFSLPGRATGGPVTAGQPYIVGERRPEVFVPRESGVIVPSLGQFAGGRGGGGAGGVLRVMIESDNEMFRGRVMQISRGVVADAAPSLIGASRHSTLQRASRPGIMGG